MDVFRWLCSRIFPHKAPSNSGRFATAGVTFPAGAPHKWEPLPVPENDLTVTKPFNPLSTYD